MSTVTVKGLGALLVAWLTYIDKTFSPLFWVLLILVFIDTLMNVHKEGQQFQKLGSMAISLGVPTYISQNFGNPELGKYLVAIMCICYLQLVVPQLIAKVSDLKISKDKTANSIDQQAVIDYIKQLEGKIEKQAEQQLPSDMQQVTIGAQDSTRQNGGV